VFSWDVRKALLNYEKHGVPFEEAATIFADPEGIEWDDLAHSQHEPRFKRVGRSIAGRLLLEEDGRWARNDPHHRQPAGES
jgi:uncharacterized DUF497 family protein